MRPRCTRSTTISSATTSVCASSVRPRMSTGCSDGSSTRERQRRGHGRTAAARPRDVRAARWRPGRGRVHRRARCTGPWCRHPAPAAPRGASRPPTGSTTFVADVLPDNHRMIDMFRQSGFDPSLRSGAGTIEVELPTAATPEALERYLQRERSAAVTGRPAPARARRRRDRRRLPPPRHGRRGACAQRPRRGLQRTAASRQPPRGRGAGPTCVPIA